MSWDESRPESSDLVRDFGLVVRSHKTEFRAGVEQHFLWTESSGLSAGEPELDASGATARGTCRAFYGTQSQVSAFRDGCLMVTSDTTRLFAVTETNSVFLGSARAITANPVFGLPDNNQMLIQSDQSNAMFGDGTFNISFVTAYTQLPVVTAISRVVLDNNSGNVAISDVTAGGFEFKVETLNANVEVHWRAVGSAAI